MRTLLDRNDLSSIVSRLNSLQAHDTPRWGVMRAPEMVCHVRGAFRMAMGEVHAEQVRLPLPPRWIKIFALLLPLRWPKNLQTVPALTVGAAEITTGSFPTDRADAVAELHRFCRPEQLRANHPFFGPLSYKEWMRYGYLHTDHHLRQFGR